MKVETRTTAGSLRAAANTDSFEICGLAAAYNVLSSVMSAMSGEGRHLGDFREMIAPGAFTRALKEKQDVTCLMNHDPNKILGRSKSGTLHLFDSPEGLRFLCLLDPNNSTHRDLHSAVSRGDIDQCSFAFSVEDEDGEDFTQEKDERGNLFNKRTLRDVNLHDVSAVTYPAYPEGTHVGARSLQSTPNYRLARWAAATPPSDLRRMHEIADQQRCEIFRSWPYGFRAVFSEDGTRCIRFDLQSPEEFDVRARQRATEIGREVRSDLAPLLDEHGRRYGIEPNWGKD